ncbi:hypothetical protein NLX71_15320 [Paenibacillus sp. MZ04-78.2]|uniref:hypothetical protein n=1 Tax=Paenibacillus sp. MZ04-78.2 TaxID=2962034 RepID=UPI0020B8F16D|nr:hypothetical protein [Paenibacillus sp. MZ04-78.2]MCP3774661.1 hypothetical protein [Paenibacillus sp. MZ04-78.2]
MKRLSKWWLIGAAAIGLTGASWSSAEDSPVALDKLSYPSAMAATDQTVTVGTAVYQEAGTAVGEPIKWTFERVNGISVTDDLKTLYELKGKPKAEETDPLFKDERTFVYDDCRIGLYDNFVQYVMVPVQAGTIEIDGKKLAMKADTLRQTLGVPDWTGEDGIVYKRGQRALKLFLDEHTGKLLSVHYFHTATD